MISTEDERVTVVVHKHYAAPDELVAFPFGLERSTARALMRSGKLPHARLGRRDYARRSDVLALVDRDIKPENVPLTGNAKADLASLAEARRSKPAKRRAS